MDSIQDGLIAQAKQQWEQQGVVDTSLYMQLSNNGINADALIESFEEETL